MHIYWLDWVQSRPTLCLPHVSASWSCVSEVLFERILRNFGKKITKEIISRINILPIGEKEALTAGDILANLRKIG